MRASKTIGLLLLTLTACPADDGESNDTGTGTDPTVATDPTTSPSTTASMSTTTPMTDGTTTEPETGTTMEPGSTGTTTGDTDTDASSGSTGSGVFTLTSPQFEEGGLIPSEHHVDGDNTMPQLDWVGAPAGTMSFGVFFRDLDFMMGYEHSAIWNISADATGTPFDPEHVAMPSNVPGAVQCRNWAAGIPQIGIPEFGYGGPGSGSPGVPGNNYQFEVYALDVADLSAEIDQDSSLEEVEAALEAHAIESTTLTGQTAGPPE